KPALSALLNRAHPLAAKLTTAWLFNDVYYSATVAAMMVRNSVERSGKYDLSVPSSTMTFAPGIDGRCVDRSNATNTMKLALAAALASTTTFSIAARLFVRSQSGYSSILEASGSGLFLHASSGAKLDYYYSGDHHSATSISLNTWTDVVVSVS